MTKSTLESGFKIFAHVFNRTVLGMWTLLALFRGYNEEYVISGVMIFIGIPVYFVLLDKYEK